MKDVPVSQCASKKSEIYIPACTCDGGSGKRSKEGDVAAVRLEHSPRIHIQICGDSLERSGCLLAQER